MIIESYRIAAKFHVLYRDAYRFAESYQQYIVSHVSNRSSSVSFIHPYYYQLNLYRYSDCIHSA
jgi:hypothetical protein